MKREKDVFFNIFFKRKTSLQKKNVFVKETNEPEISKSYALSFPDLIFFNHIVKFYITFFMNNTIFVLFLQLFRFFLTKKTFNFPEGKDEIFITKLIKKFIFSKNVFSCDIHCFRKSFEQDAIKILIHKFY